MNSFIGRIVIIRTYSAGVHIGYLRYHEGKSVVLFDSRRLWYWSGANTLNEVANNGVDNSKSKISEPVSEIYLTECIEIIPVSENAVKSLTTSGWPR